MAEDKQERLNALRAELEKRKKNLPVSTADDSAQTKVSTEFVPPVKSPFMPALQGSERPELIKPSEVVEPVTEMVVGAGLPTIGQAVGATTGPFAPIAVPAFGAAGGAIDTNFAGWCKTQWIGLAGGVRRRACRHRSLNQWTLES